MTATQVKRRRGTEAQCLAMTPADGEVIVDSTNDTLRVGDGSKAGGFYIPNQNDSLLQRLKYVSAGGTANALTITLPIAPSSYGQGLSFTFLATATNTNAMTLAVNGEAPVALEVISGGAMVATPAGTVISGGSYTVTHNGTKYQIMSKFDSGITSVSQGDLNSSTGSVSTSNVGSTSANLTLPGGEYGFYPQVKAVSTSGVRSLTSSIFNTADPSTTYTARIYLAGSTDGGNTITCSAQQRYINASPPFDLGDGEVGGFLYVLIDSNGDIAAHYAADVPPWAYNGPTKLKPDYICPITKKKFVYESSKLSHKDLIDGATSEKVLTEISNEMKNRDMALIPTPFNDIPSGWKAVLVDPMSDKVQRFIQEQNRGNDALVEMISGGYLKIENRACSRCGPPGVQMAHFKYKATK